MSLSKIYLLLTSLQFGKADIGPRWPMNKLNDMLIGTNTLKVGLQPTPVFGIGIRHTHKGA